jgi:hypothetical protein
MNILPLRAKSDLIGASASTLCLAHCLATPFLFVAQAGVLSHTLSKPAWWGILDLLFLVISLAAVFWSYKNTSKTWLGISLWVSWFFLAILVLNEKLALVSLAEQLIYIPTISLVVFHWYNRKYCNCNDDGCCAH